MRTGFSESLLAVKGSGLVPVIPDIKLRSPKEGGLMGARSPLAYAGSLAAAGAPALSVVTEAESFGGSAALLRAVAEETGLPVLRKDFIKTPEEVLESARMGASAVLLIVSMLEEENLRLLFKAALAAGLEPLVETHTEREIAIANRLPLRLAGINNRDILRMECDEGDVSATAELARKVKPGVLIVSESAIMDERDVLRAVRAGADAVLVGTALLKAEDAPGLLKKMMRCNP